MSETLPREYEVVYIARPDAGEEGLAKILDRVRKVLDESQGRLLKINVWGKRRLAYEIDRHQKGVYYHLVFLAFPSAITELERNLRLLDEVIRFQTVLVDEDVDPTARPGEVEVSGNPLTGEPAAGAHDDDDDRPRRRRDEPAPRGGGSNDDDDDNDSSKGDDED